MQKVNRKRKVFGLLSLGLIASSVIVGATSTLVLGSNSKMLNTDNSVVKNNKISSTTSINDNKTLTTDDYTPAISSQFAAASTTNDGFLGYGRGAPVIDSTGEVVNDPSTSAPIIDDRRVVTFTTFDGILRWKFDLNNLLPYANSLSSDISDLRIADIKPMQNFNNQNNGYLVLTTACGQLKSPKGFDSNVMFMLDKDGNVIGDSINEFTLPNFGVSNVSNLIGNSVGNINIVSPYSLKITWSSASKALIQISANPFAVKKDNKAEKWKVIDYFSSEANSNDFDPTGKEKTAPVVLVEYDYSKNSFIYNSQTTATGKKVLKNLTPMKIFSNLTSDLATEPYSPNSYLLSEPIFYVKNNILGFYGTFLKPGSNADEKHLNIATYTLQSSKIVLNNTLYDVVISDSESSPYYELADYKNYSSDYTGYAFSYTPANYQSTYEAPAAILTLPFSGSVNQGFYIFELFDQAKTDDIKVTDWSISENSRIPNGSFIDPNFGNMFIPVQQNNFVEYFDFTFETSNGNSIPNRFKHEHLKINSKYFSELASANKLFPLSTTNNVYDENNQYYGKFAFASFNNNGRYKVFYFNTDFSAKKTYLSVYPEGDGSYYNLTTYENLQTRSETLGWTPKIKKLSQINDSRLSTIGSYQTVTDETPIDELPLFYLTLDEGQNSLFPFNKITTSDIVRNYDEAKLEFTTSFAYRPYAFDKDLSYTKNYEISNFKKDATILENTTYNMPYKTESGSPYIVASPLVYQGEYNNYYDYVVGDQTAITTSSGTYVYELIKDKPASISLYSSSGKIDNSVLNSYFKLVMVDGQKQIPYEPTIVRTFKGTYSPNINYEKGDVVKDENTRKLFIFKQTSNSLSDAEIFQGTDLTTLLPTDLTTNHIAIIIKNFMVKGTIPEGFSISDIELSNLNYDNLGTDSPDGKGTITANIRLKKFIDDNGTLQTNPSSFVTTPIKIIFENASKPTTFDTEYNVSQFGSLLKDMYAYQLDMEFIQKNPIFAEELIKINRDKGNITSDITSSNIGFISLLPYNGDGTLDMQISLSRWYNEKGELVTSQLKYYFIRITGFKQAIETQLTTDNVTLAPNQIGVPGLGGALPSDVTVNEFISSQNNIKNFILNYVIPSNNTKLLKDNARPAGYGLDSIIINNVYPDSAKGSVKIYFSFKSYFISENINGITKISYRLGVSTPVALTISGLKKFVDTTIDNYNYNVLINVNSSLKDLADWPSQLRFDQFNQRNIPSVFYNDNKANLNTILKKALFTYINSPKIDGKDNLINIKGFALTDIGNISSIFYNNFTGRIIFKANLRKFKILDINSNTVTDIDNSSNKNWSTDPSCAYDIALEGFEKVYVSTLNGKELPYVSAKSTEINVDSNINITNKNAFDVSYQDVENKIEWGGSFGVYDLDGNFVIKSMDEILSSKNNFVDTPYVEKDVVNNKTQLVFKFNKPVYYFAQKVVPPSITNPYDIGNLGDPIELSAGSKIIISFKTENFNVWEIVFWAGVAVAILILLSLLIVLIVKFANRRKIYY